MKHHRRSTRLPRFDYASPGAYFVTVCLYRGVNAQGTLIEAEMRMQWSGDIAASEWERLPTKYSHVALDEYVIMPNHFHALLSFAPLEEHSAPRASLSEVMAFWKYQTTRLINEDRLERWGNGPTRIWQRGFYDRIVRTEKELEFIRQYIRDNPQRTGDP